MPLRERWLTEHPLFLSGDARLVRAVVKMLMAAWRSSPAASLAPSYMVLADTTGLTEAEIAEHYEDLTYGWELRDERLFHVEMHALCDRLERRHGELISVMAEDMALAVQDPEHFELTAAIDEGKKHRGRRALRPSWRPSMDTLKDLAAMGITASEDVDYIVEKMRLWARSKGEKRSDWDATLLNFARNEPQSNLPTFRNRSPVVPLVPTAGSRFASLVSRGEAAVHHNENVFQRVRQGG